MRNNILEKQEVFKHSSAIQISNKVNLLQRRAWNVLLANAYSDMLEKDEYKISINDLAQVLKFDSKNIEYLKDILYKLVDATVEWNLLGKDKKQQWAAFSLLAEAEIINGYCHYSYGARLRKRLYNPSIYARINLSLQNFFKSKHTLALYELFVDYFDIKRGNCNTPILSIGQFRKLLGLESNEYKQFKALNRDVIRKSVKEINKKSDLMVEIEYKKVGRKVEAVKFNIQKNSKNTININKLEPKKQEAIQAILPLPEFEIENQKLFKILTTEFFIATAEAVKILKTTDELVIIEALEVVREAQKKGKISSLAGFTVSAIKNSYKADPQKKQKLEQEKRQKQKEFEKRFISDLSQKFKICRNTKAKEILETLSQEEKDLLNQQFDEYFINISEFNARRLKRNSVRTKLPEYMFFASNKILSQEDTDFIQWVNKGNELEEKDQEILSKIQKSGRKLAEKDGEYKFLEV